MYTVFAYEDVETIGFHHTTLQSVVLGLDIYRMYTNIAMAGFYDTILSCLELALDICKTLDIAELSHTILKFPELDPKMH